MPKTNSDDRRMPMMQHLAEMRVRLMRSFAAFVIAIALAATLLYDATTVIFRAPLDSLDPNTTNPIARLNPLMDRIRPMLTDRAVPETQLHQFQVLEKMSVRIKMTLVIAALLSAPYILYEAWAFVAAGLMRAERRTFLKYLPVSIALFVAGVLFAYFLGIPPGLLVLLAMDPEVITKLSYSSYFSFMFVTVLAFGAAFQLPLVTLALSRVGLVKAQTMLKSWRIALVIIMIAAAILTPSTDPFTMLLLGLPMFGLYMAGALLARRAEKRRNAECGVRNAE